MKYVFTTSVVFALASQLMAQTAISSPPDLLTKEGSSFCRHFGPYSDGRQQFAAGELEGRSVQITEVAYRLDYRNHTTDLSTGRTWSNVTLSASECPIDSVGVNLVTEWSKNSLATPSMVFSASVTWPTQVGSPTSNPAAWGDVKNSLTFPFLTPWSYSGKGGLLLDYRFQGGVMADNSPWGGSAYRSYYLDGHVTPTSAAATLAYFPSTTTCNDSAHTHTSGSYTTLGATVYALNYPTTSFRGMVGVSYNTVYTAPSAPVVIALTAAGSTTGVAVGAVCNNLHVDLSKPAIFAYGTAGTGSAVYSSSTYLLPWNPLYAKKELWGQAAWSDSTTGRFSLTRSRRAIVADGIPPTVKRAMVYHYDGNLASGLDVSVDPNFLPAMRITYK